MQLVFDLDGVLLDSETDRAWLDRALKAALDELERSAAEAVRAALYPPTVEGIRGVAAQLDLSPDRLWQVRNAHYVRVKCDAIESGELAPFEDVEGLSELGSEHDLHIASNSPTVVVDAFVETYGFDDLFGICIGRGERLADLDRLKPDPYLYRQLVDRLDGEAPDVYVGDTETDRAFAAATGMRFAHLTRDNRGVESLRDLPALLA